MIRQRTLTLLVSLLLAGAPLAAGSPPASDAPAPDSQAPDSQVTLEKIMAHPDWLGRAPEDFYWADDGQSVYYEIKREGSEARDLFEAALDGSILRQVDDAERGTIDVDGGRFSADYSRKVYVRQGDVFVKDLGSGEIRQLTRTVAREASPFFMAGGEAVAFERDDAFFVRELSGGLEYAVADLRLADDPDAEEEELSFLAAQELRLFDYLRSQKEKREAAEARAKAMQEADPTRPPLPFYLGTKVEITTRSLSPNGRWLLLGTQPKARDEGERTPMPVWITESGNIETRQVRRKVGSGDPYDESLILLDLERHTRHDLDPATLPGITEDPLAELRQAAEARKAKEDDSSGSDTPAAAKEPGGEAAEPEKPEPRPFGVWRVRWSRDGERVAILLRSSDNKDRWIATIDFGAGDDAEPALRALHHLHDPAWINWRYSDLGWLADDRTLYYLSEESGYSGLYLRGHDAAAEPVELVAGAFVVSDPQPTRDGAAIYYQANAEHPGVYEIYRVATGGGEPVQITTLGGRNSALLAPTEERLLIEHSALADPPELYVQEARAGAPAQRVTETVSAAFRQVDWIEPEIVEVPSSHVERPIYSRLYLPPEGAEAPGERRPAVVFVHGAGYLQNAHRGWSGYFREFMFHTLLARRGYVVLDMDYRASAGYGRDWRTAIYRQMGTPELEDLQDGVAWLIETHGVDPERVGVYGGSYGGFMTMMALFKDPDLFAAGAALRPVTDWAHYNHPYTSNILNTPELDPEAYARSSPIEFAAGLEKPLLICAPMLDDNVFFQDTVRLVQRLIELEKTDFETALFPVEPHGFREPSSWLNEYRRIYQLFERYVRPAD